MQAERQAEEVVANAKRSKCLSGTKSNWLWYMICDCGHVVSSVVYGVPALVTPKLFSL